VTDSTAQKFRGHIGKTIADSRPWWPADPAPPQGAQNYRTAPLV
jgi:hypothetical protein